MKSNGASKDSQALPWFPFYAGDWQLSPTVRGMTIGARGLFLELLCLSWREGGFPIDFDPVAMARICGVVPEKWDELWEQVVLAFTPDGDRRYRNRRQETIRATQAARASELSDRGRKAGRASAAARVQQASNPRSTQVNHSERERERESESEKNQKGATPPAADAAPLVSKRRSGKDELAKAVESWDQKHAPVSSMLYDAMEQFRVRRQKLRKPVWEADQWTGVLEEAGGNEDSLVPAFLKSAQSGWAGVFPKAPTKTKTTHADIDRALGLT